MSGDVTPEAPAGDTRMAALLRAVRAVSDVRQPDRVLRTIVETARELVDAQYAAMGVLGSDGLRFDDFIHSGMDPAMVELIGHLPEGRGVLGAVVQEGQPLRLRDLSDHPSSVAFPEHHPPMCSFLGVPITTGSGVVGHLYLTEKRGAPEFTLEDQDIIVALAAQAGVAIDNARSYRREQELVEELRQANAAKTDFVNLVSHELKTPITTVAGVADLLHRRRDRLDEAQMDQLLESLSRQAARLGDLVRNLLDLSRVEEGRLEVRRVPVSLGPLIQAVVDRSTPVEGHTVTVDLSDDVVAVGDPDQLDVVLTNLLSNAFRHGGPRVEVAAAAVDGQATLSVSDDGPGLSPEVRARLFDRFNRGPSSVGSGLGLSLLRALVEAQGGTIAHEDVAPTGTRFTVTLPAGGRRSAPESRAAGGHADRGGPAGRAGSA